MDHPQRVPSLLGEEVGRGLTVGLGMRGANLRAILNRVDRLVAETQAHPGTLYMRWIHSFDACPFCGYDLDGHCGAAALATARMRARPGAPPPRVVFYSVRDLKACPACARALPDDGEPPGSRGTTSIDREGGGTQLGDDTVSRPLLAASLASPVSPTLTAVANQEASIPVVENATAFSSTAALQPALKPVAE